MLMSLSRLRRSSILRRLVEFLRLARVLSRVEHPCASLLQTTRLLRKQKSLVTTSCYAHHLLHLCARARTGHGLHYEEVPRLWVLRHDASDADCHDPEVQVRERKDVAEQRAVLVQYGVGAEYGKSCRSILCARD